MRDECRRGNVAGAILRYDRRNVARRVHLADSPGRGSFLAAACRHRWRKTSDNWLTRLFQPPAANSVPRRAAPAARANGAGNPAHRAIR